MTNQEKAKEGLDALKEAIFDEVKKAGNAGITVSAITKNLSLPVQPWGKHSIWNGYLVWSILAILNDDGKIDSSPAGGKGTRARIFAKRRN